MAQDKFIRFWVYVDDDIKAEVAVTRSSITGLGVCGSDLILKRKRSLLYRIFKYKGKACNLFNYKNDDDARCVFEMIFEQLN